MIKELTKKQEALLHDLYFVSRETFGIGRDRFFKFLQEHHAEADIQRRQVANWLKANEINQLFRKREPVKDLQRTVVSAPHKLVEIDLVDMSNKASGGFNWLMNGIDVFSKKAYSVPLANKEEDTVLEGLKEMLNEMTQPPSAIRSDNGSEFINEPFVAFAEKQGITLINGKPRTPQSQANIERFNGILKRLIEMYRVQFNDPNWDTYLQRLVKTYNTTWQRTINNTPDKVDAGEVPKEEVKTNIEADITPANNDEMKQKFKVGDKVRLLLEKENESGVGGKSFRNWSDEIYTIINVFVPRATSVYTFSYQVKNPEGEKVKEKLFQSELQLVVGVNNKKAEPKKFKVSSLVKAVILDNGEQGYEVKWVGYRKKSDNSNEPRSKLIQDVPKMVKDFEEKNNVKWGNGTVSQDEKKSKGKKTKKKAATIAQPPQPPAPPPAPATAPAPAPAPPGVRRSGRLAGK